MDFLEKNWSLIAANPLPFLGCAVLVAGIVWTVSSAFFSARITTAREQAEFAEKQRDDFKSKLAVSSPEEAKTKVDRLEGELAGLNRIIALTVGYQWKPLTEAQVQDLGQRLAQLQKHRVQIMYVNQLGKSLAESFFRAFQIAGWDGATLSDGGGAHLGIIAGAGANKAALVKQAIETATPYKVELDKPTTQEWGDLIYLFVGTNPNNS
ncbi:hypothetical protein [Bradyrhizobium sp. USDA 4506]